MVNKQTVLSFFRQKIKKPLSFREIVTLTNISHSEAHSLKGVLKKMLKDGDLVLNRNGLYVPAQDSNLLTGYFESHREGYGFVIPEKPGERDIFVPGRSSMGAMNSDRVVVRIENLHRREGAIVRILDRAHTQIAGRIDISKDATYVKPKNRHISLDIYIPPSARGSARHGDTVIAEITNYPGEKRPASGKILKVIAKPETPASEIEAIIDELNIPRKFPKNISTQAHSLHSTAISHERAEITGKRKDLTSLATVTIDGERAKDFDDAISIKLTEHGYCLMVHIADVGFYVPWDSDIDLEARKRGTSIYFPDRVIPMLPQELSEDLCSLKPEVDRYAFTVEMDFDRHGSKTASKFYPSLIRSNARMTYTSVKKILIDSDPDERRQYHNLLREFELMGELCGILRAQRLNRGSLDFDLPEPEILLDIQGNPEAIIRSERNFAHMMIEEFMISANESVAEHLEKLGIPSLYRIHEKPDSMKIEDIIKVLKPISRINKRFPEAQSIRKPKDFSSLLQQIKGRPEEEIVNYMVLRSLKQARYSPTNVGHFGLASKSYTHFTSPIRRYPDLVVHRILREVLVKNSLSAERIQKLERILPEIAFSSSRMERLADDAEYAVIDAMRAWFMKDKIGDKFEGTVVNVTAYGLKIRLKEFFVVGFLHVSYMTDDFYEYNEKSFTLRGKHTKRTYSIGKEVTVRVDKVDMDERSIIFGIELNTIY